MIARMITLGVGTQNAEEAVAAYKLLSDIGGELSTTHDYVSVITKNVFPGDDEDDVDELHHDENTLFKVRAALLEGLSPYGLMDSEHVAYELINAIQNAGILFRERRR